MDICFSLPKSIPAIAEKLTRKIAGTRSMVQYPNTSFCILYRSGTGYRDIQVPCVSSPTREWSHVREHYKGSQKQKICLER